MTTPLTDYLAEIRDIHASGAGVKETSYYVPLANLFNEIGKTLKPKVRAILQLQNRGAGLPDGGFFTPEQLRNAKNEEPLLGQIPSRGVVEVKGAGDDVTEIAKSKQVKDYLNRYGQVLVTNYRDFLLIGKDDKRAAHALERFRLADSEASFWNACANPQKTADAVGDRFSEYLKRVMLHAAPLNDPKDLAFFLASYARDALARVESAGDLPELTGIRTALEEGLGMKFEQDKGEHFFRSTLVQTLFYGIFSAWVLWHKADPLRKETYDWRLAAHHLGLPVLRKLFHELADPGQLAQLRLSEVLDWAGAALERVERPEFFARFAETHAVQYFYEPFLAAFDPELRDQLGVWYTPPDIVKYMVARVDHTLRETFKLSDGLADPNVFILDPCCGTGTYLVEVLRCIGKTVQERRGEGALAANAIKEAAQHRVFGFEILPAPFVVAHLQLGLLLQQLGAPLNEKKQERAGVYLTNALTGWEPPKGPKQHLLFTELEEERDAAERVKRHTRILVILGNPPYNGFAGVAVDEERELSNAYRTTKRVPAPQGQGLNDLYVRFYRMAERRIAEQTGEGIVCFISNYSWLDGLSFTGMRERYLEAFDQIAIDCLNGDKYKTGKLTPEGESDPSVFSTEFNREGIQVGTAIATLVRKPKHTAATGVSFRHFWGKGKREELLESVTKADQTPFQVLKPAAEVGLPFVPALVHSTYFSWPLLTELFPVSFPGVKTSRDAFLVDIDREALEDRLSHYFDAQVSHDEMRKMAPVILESNANFEGEIIRDQLRKRGFLAKNVVRYCYRPFDVRWLYWEPETNLLDRNRPDYFLQVFEGNNWLEARQKQTMENFDRGYFVRVLADNFGNGLSNFFPLYLQATPDQSSLFDRAQSEKPKPNLSEQARDYLSFKKHLAKPEDLFYHTLAVLHSPAYCRENAGALRQDWPRVPLPKNRDALLASAKLGKQIAALLDVETPVPGVTTGKIRDDLKVIAVPTSSEGKEFDLKLTARWGHAGKNGVTMPGKGKVSPRTYQSAEAPKPAALAQLGKPTLDVYLNQTAYWKNVPENVWDYTLGGYQVIKKWLSYREHEVLGRSLTADEAREVTHMARRIAALLLLQPDLDKNYESVKKELVSGKEKHSRNQT